LVSEPIHDAIELAKKWLLESGIQNSAENRSRYGSFNAWYDAGIEEHAFAYSEITGYGITLLLFLNKIQPDPILVQRAVVAGNWLIDRATEKQTGGVLCRLESRQDTFVQRLCAFDNGMCLNGLVNLFKTTGDTRYLNAGMAIADWLISMQKPDGAFYPRYFVDIQQLEHAGNKWSKQPGSYHAKLAIGLLNLADVTQNNQYALTAGKICDWAVSKQLSDGRFVTDPQKDNSFLHPVCYTLEGLLVAGQMLRKEQYLKAAQTGLEWIWNHRKEDGGFPAYYTAGKRELAESPDINAQISRLYLLLNARERVRHDEKEVDASIGHLLRYQCLRDDYRALGGFVSGEAWFLDEYPNGIPDHVNAWVTMFVLQTLLLRNNPSVLDADAVFYLI
jgi:uncharacterized protein YyaL (SSP411 family)